MLRFESSNALSLMQEHSLAYAGGGEGTKSNTTLHIYCHFLYYVHNYLNGLPWCN